MNNRTQEVNVVTDISMGIGVTLVSFGKSFNMMGKVLSGKLSCVQTALVIIEKEEKLFQSNFQRINLSGPM